MMNRPLHDKRDRKGIDESTDTYDTIDWLVKNVPKNNGTWYPLYDRNPQEFVANIFLAQSQDYQSATQKIYESPRYPSHLTLPVMK